VCPPSACWAVPSKAQICGHRGSESNKIRTVTCPKPESKVSANEPHVGIFFYVNRILHIESTPLSQAECRGDDFLIHPSDHISYWETALVNTIPGLKGKSYDFYPRGRVAYSIRNDKFLLHHDICIPEKKIAKVMKMMNLRRSQTKIDLDAHYRCAGCNGNYVSDSIWDD
jgi:hypothetical protein